ncbi:MAG: hypothetical protein E4H17_04190 [Gemmatimonadales bacterium]|nr:MAG: hypothetical protein E4H17_04190 [Gemmatimonadales bacterium]
MAVRALTLLLALLLTALPAAACFGPKLYLGVAAEPRQELLFAVVSLYVQEKTGVESEMVPLAAGVDPAAELRAERVDLAFAAVPVSGAETLLAVAGYPLLIAGHRPLTDLQFTTVAPALRKLASLLTVADLHTLESRVAAGETPLAAARRLFKERRWI